MKNKWIMLAGVALLSSTLAFAAAPTTGTSKTTLPSKILDKVAVSYLGVFNGPSVNGFGPNVPNSDGIAEKKVNMEHYLFAGYKLNPKTQVGVVTGVTHYMTQTQDYSMKDPVLKITNSSLYTKGTFSFGGDARFYVPATAGTRNADIGGGFRLSEAMNYDLPNTKYSVGMLAYQRTWLIGKNTPKDKWNDLEMDFNPYVSYQINPKLGANVSFDKTYVHGAYDVDGFTNLSSADRMSMSVGASWAPNKKISFNPGLSFYPESPSIDSTTVGFWMTATIL